MTAIEILDWFDLTQGTATKSDIVKTYKKIPDEDGEDHTSDFIRIGCESST